MSSPASLPTIKQSEPTRSMVSFTPSSLRRFVGAGAWGLDRVALLAPRSTSSAACPSLRDLIVQPFGLLVTPRSSCDPYGTQNPSRRFRFRAADRGSRTPRGQLGKGMGRGTKRLGMESRWHSRGSAVKALEFLNDPVRCRSSRASTSLGEVESRRTSQAGIRPSFGQGFNRVMSVAILASG